LRSSINSCPRRIPTARSSFATRFSRSRSSSSAIRELYLLKTRKPGCEQRAGLVLRHRNSQCAGANTILRPPSFIFKTRQASISIVSPMSIIPLLIQITLKRDRGCLTDIHSDETIFVSVPAVQTGTVAARRTWEAPHQEPFWSSERLMCPANRAFASQRLTQLRQFHS